jgi:hypothetical protein
MSWLRYFMNHFGYSIENCTGGGPEAVRELCVIQLGDVDGSLQADNKWWEVLTSSYVLFFLPSFLFFFFFF